MKIELKNVKVAEFASEETTCFEASVYVDNVRVMFASNDGHGGSNNYYPANAEGGEAFREALEKLRAHAASQPQKAYSHGLEGSYQPDVDSVINDLLGQALALKDMRRALKKCINFTKPDQPGVFHFKKAKPTTANFEAARSRNPEIRILNTMPEEEALAIWMDPSNG